MVQKSEKVPKAMQETFDRIVAITADFCRQHLNDEYAQLIRFATAALCRKNPSPLTSGRDKTWACGITHAIGMVNFLFDSSHQPYISAMDLYQWFGVSASTGQAKSKLVRDTLGMHQMDPDWCVPSLLDRNPLAWLVSVNGLLIDIRLAPREVQEIAYAKGLIPYIPSDHESTENPQSEEPSQEITPSSQSAKSSSTPSRSSKKSSKSGSKTSKASSSVDKPSSPDALYILDVYLIDGPVTEKFVAKNPVVSRTIKIQGKNTLEDLHHILFKAFNRYEEHLYEFQVGGKTMNDPKAKCYGLKQAFDSFFELPGQPEMEDAATTTMTDLNFSVGDIFAYRFDFGDEWWHQIDVVEIQETAPQGQYPKVSQKVGASPPQYANFD